VNLGNFFLGKSSVSINNVRRAASGNTEESAKFPEEIPPRETKRRDSQILVICTPVKSKNFLDKATLIISDLAVNATLLSVNQQPVNQQLEEEENHDHV
jgi:hypothetical protein